MFEGGPCRAQAYDAGQCTKIGGYDLSFDPFKKGVYHLKTGMLADDFKRCWKCRSLKVGRTRGASRQTSLLRFEAVCGMCKKAFDFNVPFAWRMHVIMSACEHNTCLLMSRSSLRSSI